MTSSRKSGPDKNQEVYIGICSVLMENIHVPAGICPLPHGVHNP